MEMEQFLPIEIIITEILSRLPVNSVIQCKCVCKTWRALIDDPAFADVHTHRLISTSSSSADQKSAQNHSNSSVVAYDSFILVMAGLSSNSYQKQYQYHFVEYNDDNRITLKPSIYKSLLFPLESLDGYWHVSCSCNGLIFMHSHFTIYKHMNHMIVCNPCTREYVNLVPNLSNNTTSSENNPRYHFTFLAAHGFGYHPHTKEYKIVIISYHLYYSGQVVEYTSGQVIVYTLGSGRWRSKGKLPNLLSDDTSVMILDGPGVLVNGVLHWIVKNEGKENIVLFDLEDEEFRVVPSLPSHPGTHLNSIGLCAGCLCAMRYNFKDDSSDFWVTKNKEYSWTREFSIPWNHEEKFNWNFLACLKGGKILLFGAIDQRLVFYDPETDSFEKNESFPDDFKWFSFSWIPYKKSFVSLKALGEKDTKHVSISI